MNNNDNIKEIMIFGLMKSLSAIFDKNNGKIVIDKEDFEKAEIGYYIKCDEVGEKLILTKVNGKSKLYFDMFGQEN